MRVGYRFLPTDEELINHFLKHKMDGDDDVVDEDIREIDLLRHEPWELPRLAAIEDSVDQEWYFFCRRDSFSQRPSRKTKTGYWKSTGRDRSIKAKRTMKEIGTKKTLVFHKGRFPNGVKTNWVIHEYLPKPVLVSQTPFVLIKLKKNIDKKTNTSAWDEDLPARPLSSDPRNHPIVNPFSEVDQGSLLDSVYYTSTHHPQSIDLDLTLEESLLLSGVFNNTNALNCTSGFDELESNATELADSFLDSPDKFNFGATSHTAVGNSYVHQGQLFQSLKTPNTQNWHASSNEYRQIMSGQILYGASPSLSNNYNMREINGPPRVETRFAEESFSVCSSTDSSQEIDIELHSDTFSDDASPRTWILQSMSGNGIQEKGSATAGNPNPYKKQGNLTPAVSEQTATKATKHSNTINIKPLPPKPYAPKMEKIAMESKSEKDRKMPQAESCMKLITNRLGSFIRLETIPFCHNTSPSVYIVNMLVGLVLFVGVIREMLIFH